MAYESHHLRRYKARYNHSNADNPLVHQLVQGGVKLTPDGGAGQSAKISVYDTGGSLVLSPADLTISGTLLSYSLSTTTVATYPVGTGYRAHIAVVVAGVTVVDEVMFDIAKFVPFGRIGRDQLIALDDRLKGMEHNGDEDFSEIIEAVRDEVQFDLETKAFEDKQVTEDMALDYARLGIVARFLVVSRILREKGMVAEADYYENGYKAKFRQFMQGIKYDKNQDLQEDGQQGGIRNVRLLM